MRQITEEEKNAADTSNMQHEGGDDSDTTNKKSDIQALISENMAKYKIKLQQRLNIKRQKTNFLDSFKNAI